MLVAGEKILFSEVKEYIDLGHESLKDSLWLQAGENFDSALTQLSILEGTDSLSANVYTMIKIYRDSVQKLLVSALSRTTNGPGSASWNARFNEEMGEVSDSSVKAVDSIIHRINAKDYDLPLTSPVDERILQAIVVFMGPGRGYFTKWLSRKSRYEEMVQKRLTERKMPKDLLYLAMVESGFNPKAWSKAKASGMWQFITGTGRRYGLQDDWWVDPRRDPFKATDAALDYLEDLYEDFGDWHMAMAAYNCGEGKIRRMRAKDSTLTYWNMPLPPETRFYVPKILAAMIIGHNPERYGFTIDAPEPPLVIDTATVQHCLSLGTIAKAAGVTEEQIISLNPSLRRWCTPPNREEHTVYLPPGTRGDFWHNYELLDKTQLVNWHHHVVARGENLGSISSKYRVSVAAIKATNKIKGNRLAQGQSILIPLPPDGSRKYLEPEDMLSSGNAKYSGANYRVKPGDNLFDIARRCGTKVSQLLEANNLPANAVIKPGQKLSLGRKAAAPEPDPAEEEDEEEPPIKDARFREYKVLPGENLFSISLKLGVSLEALKKWNNVRNGRIQGGQKLTYVPAAAKEPVAEAKRPQPAPASPVAMVSAPGRKLHRVKPGETIYAIAREHDTNLQAIMDMNGLAADARIFPGDSLYVAGFTPTSHIEESRGPDESQRYYVVKSGDSLWDISVKFRSTVQRLKELNGQLPSVLRPGTKIRIQ